MEHAIITAYTDHLDYNSVVRMSCDRGYRFKDGTEEKDFICDPITEWQTLMDSVCYSKFCYLYTYTQFTYNRLDLSCSIPKVSPSYQPMSKFLTLAAANYLQICCFWAKTYLLCNSMQLNGNVYDYLVDLHSRLKFTYQ